MSKNKGNVLYSGCLCPVILTKEDLFSFIAKDNGLNINCKEINFQYAMLKYKSNNGITIASVNHNEIVSFMIITFEIDYRDNKKWCMIRYYYQPKLYKFEEYSLDRFLDFIIKIAQKEKCNYIGVPKSIVSKIKYDYNVDKKWVKYNFIKCFYKVYSVDGYSETIHICRGNEYSNYESDDEIISNLYQQYKHNNGFALEQKDLKYDDLAFRGNLNEIMSLNQRVYFKNEE